MSKTDFSPGPWEAQDMFKNWLIVDCNDIIIDIRGNEANAKLIASAPDMYKALSEILTLIALVNAPLDKNILTIITLCERAIVKAEGKK